MNWIYISPHLDDAALSCGGLAWDQYQQGESVSIWTVCAGDPPASALSPFAESLHARWQVKGDAVEQRRNEDIAACLELKASYRHLAVPDCIYRRSPLGGEALYATEDAICGPLHPAETTLVRELSGQLASAIPRPAVLVCPLAAGGHVDHRLTRAAVEQLFNNSDHAGKWSLWYYADYPYVRDPGIRAGLPASEDWIARAFPVSAAGLSAWKRAVAAYRSQISTFWPDLESMQAAVSDYAVQEGGVRLWSRIFSEQVF